MDNMPALIQYLLKLSVSMAVVYLFYQLVFLFAYQQEKNDSTYEKYTIKKKKLRTC